MGENCACPLIEENCTCALRRVFQIISHPRCNVLDIAPTVAACLQLQKTNKILLK